MLDAPRGKPKHDPDQAEGSERVVLCRACEVVVARPADRVVVGSGELHTFVNPRGQVFELVCYAVAEGAVAVGEATLEYTWFPGHAWRFAFCRGCGRQLGWRYDGPDGGFWGLQREALREADEPGSP
jgi:hypothetical protein